MVRLSLILLSLLIFTMPTLVFAVKKVQQPPEISLTLSKQNVWQREQVIITLSVTTKDLLARLDSQEFTQNGLTIISTDLKEQELDGKLHLSYQWIVFPLSAGEHALKFPRIRYRPNSGRPVKLDLPERIISVKPLPIYVPPTMPVGEVTLENDWNNGFIISSKKLFEWTVKAHSRQVAPQTLPALSRLLLSSESLNILPPKRNITMHKSKKGLSHQQKYQIPIKANQMGLLNLPKISIQYFDPTTAKLKIALIETPLVFVLNPWLLWLIIISVVVLILMLIKSLVIKLQSIIKQHQMKKAALQSLRLSTNYQQIRAALREYASSKNWSENTTLTQFASKTHGEARELIKRLQDYEFSGEEIDDAKLKQLGQELTIALN